ncbi:hypothetical protein CLAFUW4_01668 [Fulvia fulva]|uniref:Uncharacterized protein n=1 Tax=Passalora fulva TaxID=5499 RepID=A0A9Q8P451_PASFU|nr:uncharacterized protein CLAFUR5_01667 [Fulvia fulva]KAK4635575.1 hypothetical protein CLAFUR4_01666 [Fulvia fulva]KAK4637445.1 hypothetical protein CLAFUR0_01667 [Fulvia fulva]UJO12451.1 hypothetical protein CLAFUR5_01667 [Fulvia fulva]WPV10391.1 hypothetical protein CLAFUW4_01668 [Fulvia fulva]WPV25113.1 hypothetical protein CLAFUW7_01670 [Fulvia fulva]
MSASSNQNGASSDTASTASSLSNDTAFTTATLVNHNNNEQRTTLTGQPIPRQQYDSYTSMMYSQGGMGLTNAGGVNLLPPGYTDTSMVRIPIKVSDYAPQSPAPKKRSLLSKLEHDNDVEIKVVAMSRGDYLSTGSKVKTGTSGLM